MDLHWPDASFDVVTIGFNGVQALESGKVKAFTGFIPADGVQVEADGYPTKDFPLDEYGGPSYPGLVVFSTESKIGEDPDLMQGFVDATIKGYQDALDDPAAAIDSLISQTQGIDKQLAFLEWIGWPEYRTAVFWTSLLAPALTVLPTLVLTRKYLKV